MSRFRDQRVRNSDFMHEVLVSCPRCAKAALVREGGVYAESDAPRLGRTLTCQHCGHSAPAGSVSPWLHAPCCGHELEVWNRRHLEFLEEFVSASLRERREHAEFGWSNASLASRLPPWLKAARNRKEVLSTLRALRARLDREEGVGG